MSVLPHCCCFGNLYSISQDWPRCEFGLLLSSKILDILQRIPSVTAWQSVKIITYFFLFHVFLFCFGSFHTLDVIDSYFVFPKSFWWKCWDFFTDVPSFADLHQENRAVIQQWTNIVRLNLLCFENENLIQVGRNTQMQTRVLNSEVLWCYWDQWKCCCFIFCCGLKLSVCSS